MLLIKGVFVHLPSFSFLSESLVQKNMIALESVIIFLVGLTEIL